MIESPPHDPGPAAGVRRPEGIRRTLGRWLAHLAELPLRVLLQRRVRISEPARHHDPHDLERRTDELNAAAERYFTLHPDPQYLVDKPFSDPLELPRYLFGLGVLLHGLQVGPGDTVLELGAGSCWVSHFLNRMRCRTLAVDVSPTALALGRRLFARDPRTCWQLAPAFLVYDGHRLPLADGCCDRIVLHDAFHHIPNPRQLLREMARVLRRGGVVGMSEPGRCHSASPASLREKEASGVLENDVVVEEVAAMAAAAGFSRTTLRPQSLDAPGEIAVEELFRFVRGRGVAEHWRRIAEGALDHHFLFLYAGPRQPTTRRPGDLTARLELLQPGTVTRVRCGEGGRLRLRAVNLGDTRWLAGTGAAPGVTGVGVRLSPAGKEDVSGRDWHRSPLPREVGPGEEVEVEVLLPPLAHPGRSRLTIDLVAEQVCWFADRGSRPLEVTLETTAPEEER